MRLHGNRFPAQPQFGTTCGVACLSGADNEVWSYGKEWVDSLTGDKYPGGMVVEI